MEETNMKNNIEIWIKKKSYKKLRHSKALAQCYYAFQASANDCLWPSAGALWCAPHPTCHCLSQPRALPEFRPLVLACASIATTIWFEISGRRCSSWVIKLINARPPWSLSRKAMHQNQEIGRFHLILSRAGCQSRLQQNDCMCDTFFKGWPLACFLPKLYGAELPTTLTPKP